MLMKVAKTLISKAIIYYSLKGNTKGIIDNIDTTGYEVIDLSNNININFNKYDLILIGTSTYGRGVPPRPFFEIRDDLYALKNKKIGLFGSGNTHYEYFCGALDLLEELLKEKNEILFKFKFEGYPKKRDIEEFKQIINKINNEY